MAKVERSVLKNAAPFDRYKFSDGQEARAAVGEIYSAVVEQTYERKPRNPERVKDHIQVIVLNLFAAYFQDTERWVFYPRNRAELDSWKSISAEIFITVVDALASVQLIESHKGQQGAGLYDPETGRQLRSRMRASQALISLMKKAGVRLRMLKSRATFPLIRLRDANKAELPLPRRGANYQLVKGMQRALDEINELLSNTFIGLHVSDAELRKLNTRLSDDPNKVILDFTRKKLYRVFSNGSLERNGRFSGGWWQALPSEYRSHIYIGGPRSYFAKPSAEADYSSMFPAIAYALLGQEMRDSAYQLDGREQSKPIRGIVKLVLLNMLMNEDPRDVVKAVHKEISDQIVSSDPEKHSRLIAARRKGKTVLLPWSACAPDNCPPLREIIAAMEKEHTALRRNFLYNPDQGLNLMFKESQIAQRVMLDMAKQGAPVLPVHDSFVAMTSWVAYEHEWETEKGGGGSLDTAMRRAFIAELGVDCKVTFDVREHQLPLTKGIPRYTEASDWKELDGPFTKEERETYKTYVRHYEDWYDTRRREE